MSVFDIWKSTLISKVILVFVGWTLFAFCNSQPVLWMILGAIMLLAFFYMSFRQGQGIGHAACGVSKSIARLEESPDGHLQANDRMYKEAWSLSNGIKSIFAGALPGYVVSVVYIILMLVCPNVTATWIARLVTFIGVIPYWSILSYWHPTFDVLTADIVAVLMIAPFIMPLCQFAGYLQGPKMWEKTEKAMAEGKRRAKARSRIVKKKKTPKSMKPEI